MHADSIWHWPPFNEFQIFVDCNFPFHMEMAVQDIMKVDAFADGFIMTPGMYDDYVMICGLYHRGVNLSKFVLDVDTRKKNRCQILNNIQAFDLRGLICTNFVEDSPFGSEDLLSLFVQGFSL